MQKIWIDNTLLQSMHVHELRHIKTKYLYTDIIDGRRNNHAILCK